KSHKYIMSKNIFAGISLTDGNNMTWDEGVRPSSRMMTHGWTDDLEADQPLNSHANRSRPGGYGWSERTTVRDFEEGQVLPEKLFVIIYSSGEWYSEARGRTVYGGDHGSWGVSAAFVERENAEAFVKTETKKWLWLWVVETSRFSPVSVS
nr:hypothetical protein [Candidatus Paceibacterota bacterium]